MATVDDAVELLRDPAYLTATGRRAERRAAGFVEVNGARVVNELQARGAGSREAALDLVWHALVIVGGRDASYLLPASKGLRPGRIVAPPRQRVEVFLVPIDE
jgi:hypothetical protein